MAGGTYLVLHIDLPTQPNVKVFVTDEETAEYRRTGYLPDSVGPRIRAQLCPLDQEAWDLLAGSKNKN